MKDILILGANGQLGKSLTLVLKNHFNVFALNKNECDVTNEKILRQWFSKIKPEIVFNASAFTNVDQAEIDFESANSVNNQAVENIAKLCNESDSVLIHFSTDYVFNQALKNPITEDVMKNPINSYGLSKHLGEEKIIEICKKFYIFRICWLYGLGGDNFPKKIISLAKENKVIRIVNDQFGTPTSTNFIANSMKEIILNNGFESNFGTYHLCPDGYTNWFEFAKLIYLEASKYKKDLILEEIRPIKSNQISFSAKRPKNSFMDNTKIKKTFNIHIESWEKEVESFIEEFCYE
tara:strand:- start:1162 stop:2040 length:879 start_codon:yes stop_codon:yes gene_type:complete